MPSTDYFVDNHKTYKKKPKYMALKHVFFEKFIHSMEFLTVTIAGNVEGRARQRCVLGRIMEDLGTAGAAGPLFLAPK